MLLDALGSDNTVPFIATGLFAGTSRAISLTLWATTAPALFLKQWEQKDAYTVSLLRFQDGLFSGEKVGLQLACWWGHVVGVFRTSSIVLVV